jgi:hypothetical protein
VYNLRYHIASLVAVFLALAIGVVLGGLVVRQGGFDQQQKALVSSLQFEFNKLKKTNSSLSGKLSLESAYAKQMTDNWVSGRLAGRTVAIVTSGSGDEGADDAVDAVKSAGGGVVVVTLLKPDFGVQDSATASAVVSVIGSSTAPPSASDIASGLAAEWSGTTPSRALTDALVNAGAIKVSGLAHSTVATLALDVATDKGEPDSAGLDLAEAYAHDSFFAAAAEPLGSQAGLAAAASTRKLSAFDTLGTNAGRFTLVALFSGGDQGYYGVGAHGGAPFPPIPTP